jgi:TetR/AcrR family transcriptional repressor of mexJK operon
VHPSAENKEERRNAILDAAQVCFFTNGYGATSMSMIAARVGGSKATLYNYFNSKEEVFGACVRRVCARLKAQLEAIPQRGDGHERLVMMANGLLAHLLSPEGVAIHRLVVGEGERFPELARLFYEAGPKTGIARIAELIETLMDEGVIRRVDPTVAARTFGSLAVSCVLNLHLWGVIPTPAPGVLNEFALEAVDTFMRAFLPRDDAD